jgi:hypothetical protein
MSSFPCGTLVSFLVALAAAEGRMRERLVGLWRDAISLTAGVSAPSQQDPARSACSALPSHFSSDEAAGSILLGASRQLP